MELKFCKIHKQLNSKYFLPITAHKSADGDSIGSSLGLLYFIEKLGKKVVVCHPDKAPDFLDWLDTSLIILMDENPEEVTSEMQKADLIFCLDYNATNRVGPEMQVLLEEATCKKIMIDHHLNPDEFPTITVSETTASSTSQLIVDLIEQSGHLELLDEKIGTPLYLGILTDTGSFRFNSVKPRTHEVLAKILAAGVEHHLIHEKLSDNNTETRLRLQGYAMSEKLEILYDYNVAIISLSKEELAKYQYKKGDTDSLANLVLSIKGMKAAIVFTERHANASGGMSDLSVTETLEKLKGLIPEYFPKG